MRIIILPVFLLTTCWLLFTGCYKDKGNYQYHDINKITTGLTDSTITVFQFDTLHINTSVLQTIPDAAGLSYEWVMYPDNGVPLTRRTLDTTRNLNALISEGPGAYVLNLFITDKKTGVTTTKKLSIRVVSALNEGWLVLEDGNTNADVSIITPVDSVFHHIYSKANPKLPLPAGTHHVYVTNRRGAQNIYFLSPLSGTQVDYSTFMAFASFKDWFFIAPAPKPQIYMTFNGGEAMINDGKPYGLSVMVPPPYKFSLAPVGNYYMAPFDMSSIFGPTLYDTISQRFLGQDPYSFDLIDFSNAQPGDAFNMNNVGKHLQYAEGGPRSDQTYCLFRNNKNDSLFIYSFSNAGPYSTPTAVDTVSTAPGMSTAGIFRMSALLPHLYYASGNKLYLYDILAGKARLVYSFAAGTDVRCMKLLTSDYRTLAVATSESGEGKVYYFPIAATGDFQGNTYSKVFGGFGKINDIAYKKAP
ncbi:PKD family protein [Chitinophaga niastensis]|uniref:PKD family protein n=1 Tax=Chitinophaga niastensis TaxID=536980 RepID=A0A2P8HUF6_CHINA|nr:PKD-like family lipoprotein [Chitinophaga niastensis]PSL49856.1 PKD family protein [Chitinophaga niastensis]